MEKFKRGGGFLAFFVAGAIPNPEGAEFAAALAKQRFRSIEDAASEETSSGWVSPGDPTGGSFAHEDMVVGDAVWLRLRIDKKVLPGKWLAIHRAEAERSVGRALNQRERRELKTDLLEKLLPRVLPSVNLVDALWFPARKVTLLMNTAQAVAETFARLFAQSFAARLELVDPYLWAQQLPLDGEHKRRLDEVSPVPWPRLERRAGPRQRGGSRAEPAPVAQEGGAS